MTEQQLDCALDLLRRLPHQEIEKNTHDLIDLVPELCEDLLSSVEQPLKIARDQMVGKDYLLCDYNRLLRRGLAGRLTKSPHIANMGNLAEDMEQKMRNTLKDVSFGKTQDIVSCRRPVQPL